LTPRFTSLQTGAITAIIPGGITPIRGSKLEPDVRIEVKNSGGLFPDFDVKVNGRKKRCEFNSRFSDEEQKIMNKLKKVRTYDMDISYTEQRTDNDPLMRVMGRQYNTTLMSSERWSHFAKSTACAFSHEI
jgi:hypothetical protein